jgi:hypothetical protein
MGDCGMQPSNCHSVTQRDFAQRRSAYKPATKIRNPALADLRVQVYAFRNDKYKRQPGQA